MTHQQQLIDYIGCIIKTLLKTAFSSIFSKGVVHEQPWFSIVCLLWWFTIVSSCCLRWKKNKHSFYFFLCYCFFTFLVPFFWKSQKCQISQHIKCLVKTQLKNSTQTIFQGSSPWATLILNSMFVVVVLYCVQLLPEVIIFKHAFYLFLCLSFFFYFLSFIWNSQKCPISENIWCRIKTKKQHPNNFSRE